MISELKNGKGYIKKEYNDIPKLNHEGEYLEFLYQMIAEYAKEKAVEKKIIM